MISRIEHVVMRKMNQRCMVSGIAASLISLMAVIIFVGGCLSEAADVPRYVGATTCASCHVKQYDAWKNSDHDLAMALATDSTVLGDFENLRFDLAGESMQFRRAADGYVITVSDTTGMSVDLPVHYTFGWFPLQQFLVPFERGRLQSFPVAWDVEKNTWFPLYPEESEPVSELGSRLDAQWNDFIHWTGAGMNWNYMCAECHSTNLKKGYDFQTDSYQTTFSEINVSCEACHGPGSDHVERARVAGADTSKLRLDTGLTVRMAPSVPSDREIDVCAQCHSRRTPIDDSYVPGDAFLDHYVPELLREGLYFADGQIHDEVYVYGSFLQSKMYRKGVRCSNCHDPHTGRTRFEGNALCGQCHASTVYDIQMHTGHKSNTQVSQCVTCHMPARTYMQVDPRRDHSMHVPRPVVSASTKTPDVCLSCHEDKEPEQLRRDIQRWMGKSISNNAPSSTLAVHGAWSASSNAANALGAVSRDTTYAPIVRATMLSLLGAYSVEESLGPISRGLRDSEPLIRLGALQASSDLGAQVVPVLLIPLLTDTVRSVRIEAARQLSLLGVQMKDSSVPGFSEALDEYRSAQKVNEDQSGSHVNLAVLHESQGHDVDAKRSYENALRLDSAFVPALVNFGLLLNRERLSHDTGEEQRTALRSESEKLFRRASLGADDAAAMAAYYLGLQLAEDPNRIEEASVHLERAATEFGGDGRMYYNAGLAFQTTGNKTKAETYLRMAATLGPTETDPINALVIFYMQEERWPEALIENDRLISLLPPGSGIVQRGEYIENQLPLANSEAQDR